MDEQKGYLLQFNYQPVKLMTETYVQGPNILLFVLAIFANVC